jgi:hypothetical protein
MMTDDKEEALRTMRRVPYPCIESKVVSEEVDGIIVITFNKDNTSENYLVGQLNMSEVSSRTYIVCWSITYLLTQIDFQNSGVLNMLGGIPLRTNHNARLRPVWAAVMTLWSQNYEGQAGCLSRGP